MYGMPNIFISNIFSQIIYKLVHACCEIGVFTWNEQKKTWKIFEIWNSGDMFVIFIAHEFKLKHISYDSTYELYVRKLFYFFFFFYFWLITQTIKFWVSRAKFVNGNERRIVCDRHRSIKFIFFYFLCNFFVWIDPLVENYLLKELLSK